MSNYYRQPSDAHAGDRVFVMEMGKQKEGTVQSVDTTDNFIRVRWDAPWSYISDVPFWYVSLGSEG